MRWALAFLIVACERQAPTQHPDDEITPVPAASKALHLDSERMFADLARLADDGLAGRDSRDEASIGAAAQIIAKSYRELGLAPVGARYLVPFDLAVGQEPDERHHLWLEQAGESAPVEDAAFVSIAFGPHMVAMGDAVFVGRAPGKARLDDRVAVMLAAPSKDAAWTAEDLATRLDALARAGAVAAIVVGAPGEALPDAAPLRRALEKSSLPAVFVTHEAASAFATSLDGDRPLAGPRPIDKTRASLARRVRSIVEPVPNVLATLPGTDLAHEVVVLGAHYDHIGTEEVGVFCRDPAGADDPQDQICNGADDNASGTAMVLAVARAMATAEYRPRRSIVFAHFAGEELGLHGSRALVEKLPDAAPFRDGHIVAMVNLDMVGRLGDAGLEIGAVSTSPSWTPLLERLRPADLKVTLTPDVDSRSDHANFAAAGIPALFFFTGLHDDYHRTSDELADIAQQGMATIGGYVLAVVRTLGDGATITSARPTKTRAARIRH